MVDEVLEYVETRSKKGREPRFLTRETTDGPEGALSKKCFKSLKLMVQSLRKLENKIKDLSSSVQVSI